MPVSSSVLRAAVGPPLNQAGRCRPATSQIAGADLAIDEDVGRPIDWRTLLEQDRLAEADGAFALAWMRPDGGILLARDAIGERTLFYAETTDGLVFAPTIRVLL